MKFFLSLLFSFMAVFGMWRNVSLAEEIQIEELSDEEIVAMLETIPTREINFPDVKEGDWYFPFVKKLFDQGIMEGYPDGRFGSWDPINRAEFAKVIVKLQERWEKPWYEEHLISILLVAINVIGWLILLSTLGGRQQPVNVNVEYPKPSLEPRRNEAETTKSEPSQGHEKNATTNWWNT